MSERAGLRREYTRHFLLDEGKLRKLADILRDHGQRLGEETYLKFYVERENKSFYETRDIGEVLGDDNTPGRTIRVLTIEIQKTNPDPEELGKPESERKPVAYIAFSRFRDEKVIFFTAAKNRDWCFLLAEELDSQVNRILKGKSLTFLSRMSIDFILLLVIGAGVMLWTIWALSQLKPAFPLHAITAMSPDQRSIEILKILSDKTAKPDYSTPLIMITFAVMIALFEIRPVSRLLENLRRSVFYWGDIIPIQDRYQRTVHLVTWGVIIAFVVSVLASVVATHISW